MSKSSMIKTLYFCGSAVSAPYIVNNLLKTKRKKEYTLSSVGLYINCILFWPVSLPLCYLGYMDKIVKEFD